MEGGIDMVIEYLKMEDFRQFKGHTEIQFSCDSQKNVTVILGDNTFGKTTLLQAFNWCFYGEVNLPHADSLLNYEVERHLPENVDKEVSVEIGLIHQDIHYTIKRKCVYEKTNGTTKTKGTYVDMWYKEPDGQTTPIQGFQIAEKINSILPQDLSSYFFFDTERVQDVSERKDLSAAVKGLLGLDVLDNAKRHLGGKIKSASVIGQFYGELAKCSKDAKVDQAMEQIQIAEAKRATLSKEIKEIDQEIAKYKDRIDELDKILIEAKETKRLQAERSDLERRVNRDKGILDSSKDRMRKDIGRNFMDFFMTPLAQRAAALLKEAKVDDKGIKDLTAVTLKELLKRGVCVCGQKLEEGSEAYNHVCEEIRFVPPASIGTMIKNYKEELNSHYTEEDAILKEIEDQMASLISMEDDIESAKVQIDKLSESIARRKDMSNLEAERRHHGRQVDDLRLQERNNIREEAKLSAEIAALQKFIEQNKGDSEKEKQLIKCIDYAEMVCASIQELYDNKEQQIRQSLQNRVNEIFQKIYTGTRKVALDDGYHVKLFNTVNGKDIETGESEGLRRVKNFAFIAGLVALAKAKIVAKIAEDNRVNLSSEPYPLVMDAPFSNADEFHTANISRVLPEVAEQVIMFVMQKDWNYAQKVMDNKVGIKYQLEKINEVHTKLEMIQHV